MPFKGFICEVDGTETDPETCYRCARQGARVGCPFTAAIIRGITENARPRGLGHVSVTELLGCPRKVVLKKEHPYWVKPSEAYWAFRGQIGHAIVEKYGAGPEVAAETRYEMRLNGLTLTGKPDTVYLDRKHLEDTKTTRRLPRSWKTYTCADCGSVIREGQWKIRRGRGATCDHCGREYGAKEVKKLLVEGPPRPYDSHTQQVNVYRLLLAENGIEVETAEIVYLDMGGVLRVPVELWSLEETRAFTGERIRRLQESWIPGGVWGEEEQSWQCRFCPVEGVCAGLRE